MTPAGPHRALVYVLNGRWHLIVAPLASEEREVRVKDPNPVRQLVARDLGTVNSGFTPASFGHRLIENGFIIDPAERAKPDTVNGWSRTDVPDRWQTVCYPISEVVG
ncbi:hypothetical protein ACFVXC_08170 [Streptomyces sp. NPDC058257]|uniref:hypothetical protein n=1 Tax=Streptomyces sp. NPDC058257 TaxID=3346409 RepID=UPI0036E1EA47